MDKEKLVKDLIYEQEDYLLEQAMERWREHRRKLKERMEE